MLKNKSAAVLAFDFGASTGRAIKAYFDGAELKYEEIHRFENVPLQKDGHLYWDIESFMREIRIAVKKAGNFDSLAYDTWGVDFGLLDEKGELLENPVHYRDERTNGWCSRVEGIIPREELYERTGNQIMEINTLFQLMALKEENPKLLEKAKQLLFLPDLFAYLLGAKPVCEETIASTSQMLNPKTRQWESGLLQKLGIKESLFLPPVKSGTVIGTLSGGQKIIAVAGHDTQCAVAAVSDTNQDRKAQAFLSCGTWSLLGTETETPVLTEESCQKGLSNELGADGKINYLKNIVGLWLIQECRRQYMRERCEYSFSQLAELADGEAQFLCFIDPDAPEFATPGDIPRRIQKFCERTGQNVPQTIGQTVRCIYESLALKYRFALEQIQKMTGQEIKVLHILGGGANAKLLCQMTADACHVTVKAGPVEATALGNIILQLQALGMLDNLEEGKALIARTEKIKEYYPKEKEKNAWEAAYKNFILLMGKEK